MRVACQQFAIFISVPMKKNKVLSIQSTKIISGIFLKKINRSFEKFSIIQPITRMLTLYCENFWHSQIKPNELLIFKNSFSHS